MISWITEMTVGMGIVNSSAVVNIPLSENLIEAERIQLFKLIYDLNASDDDSSERYFPIFDLIAKINCGGMGKGKGSVSVSERHYLAYKKYLKNASFDQMGEWTHYRLSKHIQLFHKYYEKVSVFPVALEREHDQGKWLEPEYTPYVHINWKYHLDRYGLSYTIPEEIDIVEATWHHIKTHKHHPEFWDDNASVSMLNANNRDEPSGKIVDATKMPLDVIPIMMADWFAVSEEKDAKIENWIKKNVNIRWKFNQEQVDLMHKIVAHIKKIS